jgi:hypothetical protein
MAKIPTPEQLGGLLRMPGSRPTASYAVSPYARGAQQIAEAGAGFGHAIEDVGGAAYKAAERQRMLTQATMASAYINGRLLTTRDRFKNDPDYATLPQRWQDEAGAIVEKGLSLVSNDGLQERVGQEVTAPLLQENAAIQHQAFRGATEANAANREAYLQHLVRHTTLDPNDALTTSATDAYHATIDDAVSRKFLTPQDAAAEKRRAALALCAAHYDVMGRQDPERAISELQSPDCPHPVAQFLPTETKDALIAHAKDNQQAQQIDAQRRAFLQARQAQRASDGAEGTILKDLVGDNPTVTASDIVNNGTLTPDARQRMAGVAARAIQPEPPAQMSNAAAVNLIDRIRRPDGDAEKIGDIAPIVAAYNAGDVNKADLHFAIKQLDETRTPEGELLARRKQDLFSRPDPRVDGDPPAEDAQADLAAKLRRYDLERQIDQAIDRYRSDGKNPNKLFDQAMAGSIGWPYSALLRSNTNSDTPGQASVLSKNIQLAAALPLPIAPLRPGPWRPGPVTPFPATPQIPGLKEWADSFIRSNMDLAHFLGTLINKPSDDQEPEKNGSQPEDEIAKPETPGPNPDQSSSSNPEIAFVDVLTGGTTPYRHFGALLADTVQRERELHDAASTVREQLREAFDVVLEDPQKIPGALARIIHEG